MVLVSMAADGRTPTHMGSPRYGGSCVSAFLQFFDWNPSKRFSTNRRLPANCKPEKGTHRSRSFRSDHGTSAPRTRMLCDRGDAPADNTDSLLGRPAEVEDASSRAPSVVARLMGLESLPDAGPYPPPRLRHRRCQSYTGGESSVAYILDRDEPVTHHGTPVRLQDLLKRDFKKRTTLRDRMPGFAKRSQEQYENRLSSKSKESSPSLTALRDKFEEASSHIDCPQVQSRFLYSVAQRAMLKGGEKHHQQQQQQQQQQQSSPFLSRLLPASQVQRTSPLMLPSKLHTPRESPAKISLEAEVRKVSELSLPASTPRSQILLQAGWPLAGQLQRPQDVDENSRRSVQSSFQESESVGSRLSESTSFELPLHMSNGRSVKSRQLGRRRFTKNVESEDSESANERAEDLIRIRNFHRKPARVGRGSTLKRAPSSEHCSLQQSLSPPPGRNGRNSVSNVGSCEASVREFKSSTGRSPVLKAAAQKATSASKANLFKTIILDNMLDSSQGSSQESLRRSSSVSQESSSSAASQNSNMLPILTSKAPIVMALRSRASKASGKSGRLVSPKLASSPRVAAQPESVDISSTLPAKISSKEDNEQHIGKKLSSRSSKASQGKPPPLDGYRAPKVMRNPKAALHQKSAVVSGSHVFPAAAGSLSKAKTIAQSGFPDGNLLSNSLNGGSLSYGRFLGTRKEGDQLPVATKDISHGEQVLSVAFESKLRPSLGQESSPALKFTEKVGDASRITLQGILRVRQTLFNANTLSSELTAHPVHEAPGVRLKEGINPKDMATQSNATARAEMLKVDTDAVLRVNRRRRSQTACGPKNARARSVAYDMFVAPVPSRNDDFSKYNSDELADMPGGPELSVSGRYCERSCSGPSITSPSIASDVDDGRNGDEAWSSCASYNPADCDSPRTFEIMETDEVLETDAESDIHEHKSTAPMFVKKIVEESDSQAEQPSPVSILDSPFHDEACTTSESSRFNLDSVIDQDVSINNSCQTRMSGDSDVHSSLRAIASSSSDRIRQALLDISMFQSLEVFTFEYKDQQTPMTGPIDEQGFVRKVLAAAHFLSTPGSSPNWFDRDLAIDPALFDRLESGDIETQADNSCGGALPTLFQTSDGAETFQTSGGLWRCDRKLLFDCVNEAFALILWHYRGPEMWLQQLVYNNPRPRGQRLVEGVFKKIEEWRKLASPTIDLVEKDMTMPYGNWKDFSAQIAEVGLYIENILWQGFLEELVLDMVSNS